MIRQQDIDDDDDETLHDHRTTVRVPMMMADGLDEQQRAVIRWRDSLTMDRMLERHLADAARAAGLDGVSSYAEARALVDEARLAGAKADEVAWMRDRVTRHRVTRDPRGRLISTSEEVETDDLTDAASKGAPPADSASAMDAKERAWLEAKARDENAWRRPK
jgi:hypothetical protein